MTTDIRTPETLEAALCGCWVVLILSPDWEGHLPYSVVADDIGEAVAKAVQGWKADQTHPNDPEPDELEKPHIYKVYRKSWLTELVWEERDPGGLGAYDMSQLANPR